MTKKDHPDQADPADLPHAENPPVPVDAEADDHLSAADAAEDLEPVNEVLAVLNAEKFLEKN